MIKKAHYKQQIFHLFIAALLFLPLFAATTSRAAASSDTGAVYTMTNTASGNAVQEYDRAADGTLVAGGLFATGGLGSGTGLGSQGALVLSDDQHWLFAVNAGSDEISVFSVHSHSLTLAGKASSSGSHPISLTYHRGLLYVLNAGGSGSIAGFRVSSKGRLSPIRGSVRPLSNNGVGAAPSPEQIAFTPDGDHLVVSEKGSNLIDTYTIDNNLARGPKVNPSSGPAPYGFGFTGHNVLVISEAAQSAASSYKVSDKGLKVISASVPDTQAAACWLVVTGDGDFAYAANAASGTISAYHISNKGKLSLLSPNGIDGDTGAASHPIDMSFSRGDHFLYVLASGSSQINAFTVHSDGSLEFVAAFSSPAGASGLAAR